MCCRILDNFNNKYKIAKLLNFCTDILDILFQKHATYIYALTD